MLCDLCLPSMTLLYYLEASLRGLAEGPRLGASLRGLLRGPSLLSGRYLGALLMGLIGPYLGALLRDFAP